MVKRLCISLGVTVFALLTGCGPSDPSQSQGPVTPVVPAAAPSDPKALFEAWKANVLNPNRADGDMSHIDAALQLSMKAPEYLDKMIDVLADPATPPKSRFVILNSLEAAQTPQSYPRLLELTKPEVDPVLRTGVVIMLKNSDDPNVTARLRELANDPERRVRMAAMVVLSEKGDKEMRSALQQYYFTDGLPSEHRARIVVSLGVAPESSDLKVFAAAANDATIPDESRTFALNALARIGGPEGLAAIQQCASGNNSPALKSAAEKAAAVAQKAGAPAPR